MKKRAVIYCRVSTADQHPETQLYDLREMAKQRDLKSCKNTATLFLGSNRSDRGWIS